MKRSFCFVVLLGAMFEVMTAPVGCESSMSDSTIVRIEASDVQSRLGGKRASRTILVDVRRSEEYQAGHIPGAVNIGLKDAAAGKASVLRAYSTIIICGQNPGSASAMAMAKKLTGEGYPGVELFAGGFDAWRRAGLPIERSSQSPQSEQQ